MAGRGGARRPSRPVLMAALVLSLSITIGSLLFIVWRLANPTHGRGPAALVDSASWFDGATRVEPARPLADFTLTGIDGRPLGLADLAGKVTLLVFGYTSCPDYCPLTMADFREAKNALGERAQDVNFLLVSVDGEVDTPARMREWLATFDAGFLGMTGSREQVRRIGEQFGLYLGMPAQVGEQTGAHTALIDHSTSSFLIDRDGRLRVEFTFGTEPDVIADYVAELLM